MFGNKSFPHIQYIASVEQHIIPKADIITSCWILLTMIVYTAKITTSLKICKYNFSTFLTWTSDFLHFAAWSRCYRAVLCKLRMCDFFCNYVTAVCNDAELHDICIYTVYTVYILYSRYNNFSVGPGRTTV